MYLLKSRNWPVKPPNMMAMTLVLNDEDATAPHGWRPPDLDDGRQHSFHFGFAWRLCHAAALEHGEFTAANQAQSQAAF
jgi:hypothetical protein